MSRGAEAQAGPCVPHSPGHRGCSREDRAAPGGQVPHPPPPTSGDQARLGGQALGDLPEVRPWENRGAFWAICGEAPSRRNSGSPWAPSEAPPTHTHTCAHMHTHTSHTHLTLMGLSRRLLHAPTPPRTVRSVPSQEGLAGRPGGGSEKRWGAGGGVRAGLAHGTRAGRSQEGPVRLGLGPEHRESKRRARGPGWGRRGRERVWT